MCKMLLVEGGKCTLLNFGLIMCKMLLVERGKCTLNFVKGTGPRQSHARKL